MSKIIGIDLGTTNSVVAVMEGGQPKVLINAPGQPDDPVGRRLHREGRAPGRPARPAPAGHQPQEHRLLDQALHGPPHNEVDSRGEDRPLRGRRRRATNSSRSKVRDKEYTPPEISRDDPAGPQEDRRGLPRREGRPRGHHRAGLLQRLPAPGDQGRRRDRRAQGRADHQRAHRRGAGLRAREEDEREDRGLRPRRRHLRHLDPRHRRRRLRGARHQRRHPPRRRRLRPAPDRLSSPRSSARTRASTSARTPMALQRLKEAAEKAKCELSTADGDDHQPAVHHRGPDRAQAPAG